MAVGFAKLPCIGEWCDPLMVQALTVTRNSDDNDAIELWVCAAGPNGEVVPFFDPKFDSMESAYAAAQEIGNFLFQMCPEGGVQMLPYFHEWINPLLVRALRITENEAEEGCRLWACVEVLHNTVPVQFCSVHFQSREDAEFARDEVGKYLTFMNEHPDFGLERHMVIVDPNEEGLPGESGDATFH